MWSLSAAEVLLSLPDDVPPYAYAGAESRRTAARRRCDDEATQRRL
jgi:hypothetical protein